LNRREAFKKELKDLLSKYKADIAAKDVYEGYSGDDGEYNDLRIVVYFRESNSAFDLGEKLSWEDR